VAPAGEKPPARSPLARDHGEIHIVNERGTQMGTFHRRDEAEVWLANPERR